MAQPHKSLSLTDISPGRTNLCHQHTVVKGRAGAAVVNPTALPTPNASRDRAQAPALQHVQNAEPLSCFQAGIISLTDAQKWPCKNAWVPVCSMCAYGITAQHTAPLFAWLHVNCSQSLVRDSFLVPITLLGSLTA